MNEILDIEAARGMRKLSQEELGNLVGISKFSIMNYEKGVTRPPIDMAEKIRRALRVPALLIGGGVIAENPNAIPSREDAGQ
jgi:DNA-binding XRE family transcriptional regulator